MFINTILPRETDGARKTFNSDRYIYKNRQIVFHDNVGANCRDKYQSDDCFTEPDGEYYYTTEGLTKNKDGTYDSKSYHNVLRHKTDDPNIPKKIITKINSTPGDFLDHANQKKDKSIYGNNEFAESAGCTIGKGGQAHHDEYMKVLLDDVENINDIKKIIHSYSNDTVEGENKWKKW